MKLEAVKGYEDLQLVAKKLIEGFITGLHKSPYHGFSVEYSEHRAYNYGEPIRHIDWRAYTRTEKFYVKRYEEETNLRAYFLLDVSSSMYYPAPDFDKMRFSVWAAAALLHLLHRQRDAVGAFSFSEAIVGQVEAKTSGVHLPSVFSFLHKLLSPPPAPRKTALPEVLHQVARRIPGRSMVILFTDLCQHDEPVQALSLALEHCRHCAHEVLIFHITHEKTEKDLQLENRPYFFHPLEGGRRLRLNPLDVQKDYQKKMKVRLHEVQNVCGAAGASFLPADVGDSFEKVFLACLARRAKMSRRMP